MGYGLYLWLPQESKCSWIETHQKHKRNRNLSKIPACAYLTMVQKRKDKEATGSQKKQKKSSDGQKKSKAVESHDKSKDLANSSEESSTASFGDASTVDDPSLYANKDWKKVAPGVAKNKDNKKKRKKQAQEEPPQESSSSSSNPSSSDENERKKKGKGIIDPREDEAMVRKAKEIEQTSAKTMAHMVKIAMKKSRDKSADEKEGQLPEGKINELNKFCKTTVFPMIKFLNRSMLNKKKWIIAESLKELGYTSEQDQLRYQRDAEKYLRWAISQKRNSVIQAMKQCYKGKKVMTETIDDTMIGIEVSSFFPLHVIIVISTQL